MRALIVGDTHATIRGATALVEQAKETEVDEVWQTGDLGYWPNLGRTNGFFEVLSRSPVYIYFADGNHEDHLALGSAKLAYSPKEVRPMVIHMPRGHVHRAGDLNVLFFGGARSVDRSWRIEGKTWFKEELPSEEEWQRATEATDIDVVVAHDAPPAQDFDYPGNLDPDNPWPLLDLEVTHHFRVQLESLRHTLQPRWWFHGHHHRFKKTLFDQTFIWGLSFDGQPRSSLVFDTESKKIEVIE